MDLSIVIPIYNSAETLPSLVDRLQTVLEKTGLSYEIIMVDDGSQDTSWDTLRRLASAPERKIVAIQLAKNFGQQNALMCGLRQSRGGLLVTIDDDLQTPPEEIPKLIEASRKSGADVTYGTPENKRYGPFRGCASELIMTFYRMVFQIHIRLSSFRAIRRITLEKILVYDLNFVHIDGLLARNTNRIAQIVVEHRKRGFGESGYSLGKMARLAWNLFTNFSLIPLQMVSLLGIFASLAGFCFAFYYLALYMINRIQVPGFATTIIVVLVMGGVQLIALGVMGEYLGRIHMNINHQPQYVVRETVGDVPNSAI